MVIKGFKVFLKSEEGAETVEYVVISAIIIILGAAAYSTGLVPILQTGIDALTTAANTALGIG